MSEKLKDDRLTTQRILLKKDLTYSQKGAKQLSLESARYTLFHFTDANASS